MFVTLSLVVCWISISASTVVHASPEDSGYSTDKLNALKDKLDPYVEDGRLPNYLLSLYHKGNLIYEAKKGHVDVSLEKPIERDNDQLVDTLVSYLTIFEQSKVL